MKSKKTLEEKIKQAKSVIEEAFVKHPAESIAVAWTGGKDSTVLLHLIKETFVGKVPCKVMFNDSTIEFPEIYAFIEKLRRDWSLDLLIQPHLPADLDAYHRGKTQEEKMEAMRVAKINAINYVLANSKLKVFLSGIRWDEHVARSREKYFSPRLTHLRVHPILDFTLEDIWDYTRQFQVPYVTLYDQGYKSLGEAPFTRPVANKDAPERAGREATKEKTMARLRKLGYW